MFWVFLVCAIVGFIILCSAIRTAASLVAIEIRIRTGEIVSALDEVRTDLMHMGNTAVQADIKLGDIVHLQRRDGWQASYDAMSADPTSEFASPS